MMHQAGVQESRGRVFGGLSLWLYNVININTVVRAAILFQGILDLLPKNLKLS